MKIESALDIINKGWEENMPSLDKGILLLDAFVKYQASKLSADSEDTYKNLLDYVLFVEGLQYPFFYCLNRVLSNSETIGKLCAYIINLQCQYDKRLNAKEAYQLLLHINNIFMVVKTMIWQEAYWMHLICLTKFILLQRSR